MSYMHQDFGEAWKRIILPDGSLKIPFHYMPDHGDGMVWHVDRDGLMMTVHCVTPRGGMCLMTVLFPMDQSKATWHMRCKRLPFKIGDVMHITKRKDVVTGTSGEVYSRFLVDVKKGNP